MGRRSDHSREELYDLAIDAARQIVETAGFSSLTARKVAQAIGYSPGTLYNVFDDLDDLIVHLNGQTLDALFDKLSTAPRTYDPEQDLQDLLGGYLDFLNKNRNLWSVLFEHKLSGGQTLPDWYLHKISRVLGLVETALARHLPGIDDATLANAARVIWASLHGICSLAESGKLQIVFDQSDQAMAEMLITCFVAGLQRTQDL